MPSYHLHISQLTRKGLYQKCVYLCMCMDAQARNVKKIDSPKAMDLLDDGGNHCVCSTFYNNLLNYSMHTHNGDHDHHIILSSS